MGLLSLRGTRHDPSFPIPFVIRFSLKSTPPKSSPVETETVLGEVKRACDGRIRSCHPVGYAGISTWGATLCRGAPFGLYWLVQCAQGHQYDERSGVYCCCRRRLALQFVPKRIS